MSDLFGNHIVGFPTRRLNHVTLLEPCHMKNSHTPASRANALKTCSNKVLVSNFYAQASFDVICILKHDFRERSGIVVERRTPNREALGLIRVVSLSQPDTLTPYSTG